MPARNDAPPPGTVTVLENVPVVTAGSNVASGSWSRVNVVAVAGARPRTVAFNVPVYPDFAVHVSAALPFPDTSAGAAMATGRITTGIRTTWPLSPVQVTKPCWYTPIGADVRRNVTLNCVDEPGAAANEATDGVAVMPVRPLTANEYVSDCEPTLFAVRVTVCEPARSPIAIDAWFRSLASSDGTAADVAQHSFWPLRNASQSLKPLSKTRPGSAALFGATWPPPYSKIPNAVAGTS